MKIYFGHSSGFDYKNEYYKPIEQNKRLQSETLIFPHKDNTNNYQTREFYTNLDLFIAEVSHRSTGLGMELGWASDDKIPIFCFYKKGIVPNPALNCISNHIIEYESLEQLSKKIENIVVELSKAQD